MAEDESSRDLIEPLTGREIEVVARLAQGKTNQEIANDLVLSLNTIKWYTRQIYEKLGVSDRQQAVQQALALHLLPASSGLHSEHNLPAQLTPFVGRQEELAQLSRLLGDPQTRLITLVGPGGIGKTRLALQLATAWLRQSPQAVPDGVYYLSLSAIDEPRDLAETLAELLGLAPGTGTNGPAARLVPYLRSRQLLLLLDNAEHLAGAEFSAWLDSLLHEAAGLSVVVTSRTALGVRGEQLFWVGGLQLPPEAPATAQTQPLALAEESSAVTLFLQTARRTDPGFALTAENAATVTAICAAVGAMPLGIVLAAAWMGVLTPGELLEELERNPDILSIESGNVPSGQRSLRAVFDTSWNLLTVPEREAVRSLSYFRGGFTRAATAAICDLGPPTLLALVHKCWVQRGDGGRFTMHELLKQYGAEALRGNLEQFARIESRHATYYMSWLAEQVEALFGPEQRVTQSAIAEEMGNIRLACKAALEGGQVELLAQAVHILGQFFRWTGRFQEGDNLFEALLQDLNRSGEAPQSVQKLRARLLVWRVSLRSFLGHSERSEGFAREADAVLERLEHAGEEMSLERLYLAVERGYNRLLRDRRPQEALAFFSEAYRLAREIGSSWEEGLALIALARALRNLRQLNEAERAVVSGLQLLRVQGSEAAVAEATALHGNILLRLHRFQKAAALLEEASQMTIASPDIEAFLLVNLGWVRLLLGELDRAEQPLARGIATYEELGSTWAILWTGLSCTIKIHQGQYEAAVESAEKVLVPSRAPANMSQVQATKDFVRGECALASQQWIVARGHLERSRAARQPTPDWHVTYPDACIALACRALGEDESAWQHLAAELKMTLASGRYRPLILSLLVGALLWADRGNAERAAAIYARVWQEPYAHNSVWLRDVAGRELDALLTALPEAVRQTAETRYQGSGLWQIAAELVRDLPA